MGLMSIPMRLQGTLRNSYHVLTDGRSLGFSSNHQQSRIFADPEVCERCVVVVIYGPHAALASAEQMAWDELLLGVKLFHCT